MLKYSLIMLCSAMKWRSDPVDIYDCRTRAWYMEAAASPKDVVILVDRSGSMTGQRRDIAKHVVTNILDTLGNNDFVSVMTFADTVEEVVPCFEDSLVQVRSTNINLIGYDFNHLCLPCNYYSGYTCECQGNKISIG